MDNYVDERDYKLIENDKYTFFVLGKIMGGECILRRLVATDAIISGQPAGINGHSLTTPFN